MAQESVEKTALKFKLVGMLLGLIAFAASSNAAIYRWVDDQGNAHYSDTKPDAVESKDVTDDLEAINRDSSAEETGKLKQVFKGQSPEEKQFRLQQKKEQDALNANKQQQCAKANKRLQKLKGRFYLIGDDGEEIVVTEAKQKEMIADLEKQIKRYCN